MAGINEICIKNQIFNFRMHCAIQFVCSPSNWQRCPREPLSGRESQAVIIHKVDHHEQSHDCSVPHSPANPSLSGISDQVREIGNITA